MKQVTITTGNATIVVVDFSDIKKEEDLYQFRDVYTVDEWSHLGGSKELEEEDWKGIVDQGAHSGLFSHYVAGVMPPNIYCYKTATESGISLLKANGVVMENPLGEEPFYSPNMKSETPYADLYEHNHRLACWQQAQSKVWVNPQIFVKL